MEFYSLCTQFELRVRVIVSFESIISKVSHGKLTLTNLTKLQISWILLQTLNHKMGFSCFFEFSYFEIVTLLFVPLNTNVSPLCQVKPASGSCRYSLIINYHQILPPHQLLFPKLFFNMGKRHTFGSPGKISEMFLIGPNGSPCSSNLQT